MIDLNHENKAIRITAVITEWGSEREIKIENVAGPFYDHKRVKIITDVGEEFIVSAWDMLRAIRACSGIGSEE